ncbi:hypothetical protein [Aestuariirhabdus sp. LZHN29]|uniref:hypothetical protein n=1 Tax=Aestuariirhabdus sp. LZHN29 TaxID=3417462 RepID=UPI003CF61EA3
MPLEETLTDYYRPALMTSVQRIINDPESDTHCWVITGQSNFHPRDYQWPDQPGDQGVLEMGSLRWPLSDCLIAATRDPAGPFCIGQAIAVKRGETGWIFCIAHRIDCAPGTLSLREGDQVSLHLDTDYRAGLSQAHSACHLMSLALNRALASYWRKSVPVDAYGSPDFDRLAIEHSQIDTHNSRDRYRLGKSLRKKGFDRQRLVDTIGRVESTVNACLRHWVSQGSPISVNREPLPLLARREWHTHLDGKEIRIPCGGTHCDALSRLGRVKVTLGLDDSAEQLTAITRVSGNGSE